MGYKVEDRVRIKSLDWYNKHTNGTEVDCEGIPFTSDMKKFCSRVMTISFVHADCYAMVEDLENYYTDEMIEGLVEEETKPESKFNIGDIVYSKTWQRNVVIMEILPDGLYKVGEYGTGWFKESEDNLRILIDGREKEEEEKSLDKAGLETDFEYEGLAYTLPEGYQFKDENGNVINTQKIVLEKKKKEYPKTYVECAKILDCFSATNIDGYKNALLEKLQELLICRDAYWKIAGEEIGLGKSWEPDWNIYEHKFCLGTDKDKVIEECVTTGNRILAFPTDEMRDAFYENFKEEIESCKELL